MKNITYTDDSFTSKVEVINRSESGETVDPSVKKMEKAFVNYAWRYNLEGNLGAKFTVSGKEYTIIGMKPQSRKAPICATTPDCKPGHFFKVPADIVQEALGIEVTPIDGF